MAREFLVGCMSCGETVGLQPAYVNAPDERGKLVIEIACEKCKHRMELSIKPCKDGHTHVALESVTAISYAN